MKIHGTNRVNANPYQQQLKNQLKYPKGSQKRDQLEISREAIELQKKKAKDVKREKYIASLKNKIDSGTYKINYEETAKKMLEFWKHP